MDQSSSFIPITPKDLGRFVNQANILLSKVEWVDERQTAATGNLNTPILPRITSASPHTTAISIVDIARDESRDALLLSEIINHVTQALKTGLTIAWHVEELYTKASGLDILLKQNRTGNMPPALQAELAGKQTTRSAIATYVLATYLVWDLSDYMTEEVSSIVMDVNEPEISFANTIDAIKSTLFYYGSDLNAPGKVNNDLEYVKFSLLYFRKVIDSVKLREIKLGHKEPFTSRKYKLDGTEFVIDGFEMLSDRSVISVEFNKVRFEEIVGNRHAKHESRRIIQRLLCYDPEAKKNPMRELGGLPPIRMGHGNPGTGKSMLIAAVGTELKERCDWLGLPFLFHPLPDNIVSTYQGGSAERMTDWIRVLRDPTKIIYSPIDDAENTFEERTRQGISAGVREVIGVFLRNTEGAYAVNNGNTLIDICTNIPEQIDKAVLSRIVSRYAIPGAETEHDLIDQDYLCYRKYDAIDPKFVGMEPPNGYNYLDDQRMVDRSTEIGERYLTPRGDRLKKIYEQVRRKNNPNQQSFFGALFKGVQDVFPAFSSRDVRNIQTAVVGRILDFDLPAEWFDDPKHFFHKVYDEKMGILTDLMRSNMKGLAFSEIRLEESLRYIDNMVEIADMDRERKIEALVEDMEIRDEAMSRFKLPVVKAA